VICINLTPSLPNTEFLLHILFLQESLVRFQVLTAVTMKMTAFWDIAACSLVEDDRRFRGACCILRTDDGGGVTRL
jgi:hypothetical protein